MKTKTKEETDGNQSHSEEIQVRELDAALRQEREDRLTLDTCVQKELYKFEIPKTKKELMALTKRKDMLREFKKAYLDNEYFKLFDSKPLVNTLRDIIAYARYKRFDTKSGFDMYVKFAEDQSVEVITLADVATAKPGKVEKGFTHTKLNNINKLKNYEKKLLNISSYQMGTGPRVYSFMMGVATGAYGATSTYASTQDIALTTIMGLAGFLIGVAGSTALKNFGKMLIHGDITQELTDKINPYRKKSTYGKEAIKKALYQIDGKDIDLN